MLVEIAKFGKEERAVCTSLDIAETFGKEHKNVLRDVENLGCSKSLIGSILSRSPTPIL